MREIIDKKPAAVFFTGGLLIQTANVIIDLNMTRMLQIYIDQDTTEQIQRYICDYFKCSGRYPGCIAKIL